MSAASPRTVVVGAGMAAVRLVEELVARGAGKVTVVGDERQGPYNRILLSAVLEGSHRAGALSLRAPAWFQAHGVDLRLGVRVAGVDPHRRCIDLDDGAGADHDRRDYDRLNYDRLVLATGSRPTLPPVHGLIGPDGTLHPRVFAFRSLDDCRRLSDAARDARRAVIVGGGLLGVQVARALSVRGLDTEIVEGGEHVLRRSLDPRAGAVLERSLARLGTRVYPRVRAVRLTDRDPVGPDRDGAVDLRLDNGVVLDTDLVVVTAGSRPAVGLAVRAGLTLGRGIVVDDELRTSDPAIHAIGDCAEHVGRRGLPLAGFVPPAWEQAEVLAAVLTGEPARYRGTRAVARLRATDLDVAVLGDPHHAAGEVVELSNPVRGTHGRLVVRDGAVVAGTLVGDLSRIGVIGKAFAHRTALGPREAGALLLPDAVDVPTSRGVDDAAEICACAGVAAGRIRACTSLEEVRERTRATTGCGGCAPAVAALLENRDGVGAADAAQTTVVSATPPKETVR